MGMPSNMHRVSRASKRLAAVLNDHGILCTEEQVLAVINEDWDIVSLLAHAIHGRKEQKK